MLSYDYCCGSRTDCIYYSWCYLLLCCCLFLCKCNIHGPGPWNYKNCAHRLVLTYLAFLFALFLSINPRYTLVLQNHSWAYCHTFVVYISCKINTLKLKSQLKLAGVWVKISLQRRYYMVTFVEEMLTTIFAVIFITCAL